MVYLWKTMAKKFYLILLAGLSMAPACWLSAETPKEIVDDFELQKAAALETFLTGELADEARLEALEFLAASYQFLEENAKHVTVLSRRYDLLPKGADADLRQLIGRVVEPLFKLHLDDGNKGLAEALLDQVTDDIAGHAEAERVAVFFESLRRELAVPQLGDAMKLAFTDVEGEAFDLENYLGKVVLVDFWATWCGPCLAELPHVISTHKKYHAQGFEVVGVSLDEDIEAMKDFCRERGMTWVQACDGTGWEGELARSFGISSIPATFLIDKDGRVAATSLHGEALAEKVAELLIK